MLFPMLMAFLIAPVLGADPFTTRAETWMKTASLLHQMILVRGEGPQE
jgi:hypothetical protein